MSTTGCRRSHEGRMKLLCVDDDRVNALLFEQVCLQVGGIELQCVESGAQAETLAATWLPDLLVIDLHLPDTDGWALLPRLRAAAGRSALPAVLCTAESLGDVAPRAAAVGFDQTWSKPVVPDELRAAIARLARR
jgi:two-component system, OmpR family, response regulator